MSTKLSLFLVVASFIIPRVTTAQGTFIRSPFEKKTEHPLQKPFFISAGELVFSFGQVDAQNYQVDNKLRFSLFPHLHEQFHYNFGKSIGIYSGISLINIGFINKYTLSDSRSFQLRHRALALGIPLAIKIGNLESGNYVALGASAEFMTQYKTKFYYKDEKVKNKAWFADEVNIFNPALFLDVRHKSGFYLRFKYYLNDFLKPVPSLFSNPNSSEVFTVLPTRSSMFYISFGSTFLRQKDAKKNE